MNIAVCIKRVPDTETRVRVADGGTTIATDGVKYVVSPYDEFAVEAALRLREAAGKGEVTVFSLGDASSQETLRSALAMGADKAVLLNGAVAMDGLATAKSLADALRDIDARLILFGVKAADGDQQQVGPMVATLLDLPCATNVGNFEVKGDTVECQRGIDGGVEVVELPLPAVITVTKGAFEPRYASLKGIMAAKRKPLEEVEPTPQESRLTVDQLSLPPERTAGRIVGEGADAVPELVRILREEAGVV